MIFKEMMRHLKKYKAQIAFLIALAIATSVYTAIMPFISRYLIDDGLLKMDVNVVIVATIIMTAFVIIGQIIEYIQTKTEVNISNSLSEEMKIKAFDHGIKLKTKYYKEKGFYQTVGDAIYDIDSLLSITSRDFMTFAVLLFKTLGASVALFLLDWRLSLCLLGMLPIKIVINILIARKAKVLGEKRLDNNKEYNEWFDDIISGINDIKLWGLGPKKVSEYDKMISKINISEKSLRLLNTRNNAISQIRKRQHFAAHFSLYMRPCSLFSI